MKEKIICKNCNLKNSIKREYCYMCGTELPKDEIEIIEKTIIKKDNNKYNNKFIIIGIITVIIIIATIFIINNNIKQGKIKQQITQNSENQKSKEQSVQNTKPKEDKYATLAKIQDYQKLKEMLNDCCKNSSLALNIEETKEDQGLQISLKYDKDKDLITSYNNITLIAEIKFNENEIDSLSIIQYGAVDSELSNQFINLAYRFLSKNYTDTSNFMTSAKVGAPIKTNNSIINSYKKDNVEMTWSLMTIDSQTSSSYSFTKSSK